MNVTESNAVFTLLRWLGAEEPGLDGHLVTHKEAGEALAQLGQRAGQRLQLSVPPAPVIDAVERFGAVVTAARGVLQVAGPETRVGDIEEFAALSWALHDCKARG